MVPIMKLGLDKRGGFRMTSLRLIQWYFLFIKKNGDIFEKVQFIRSTENEIVQRAGTLWMKLHKKG